MKPKQEIRLCPRCLAGGVVRPYGINRNVFSCRRCGKTIGRSKWERDRQNAVQSGPGDLLVVILAFSIAIAVLAAVAVAI